jgi:hypothetical protein
LYARFVGGDMQTTPLQALRGTMPPAKLADAGPANSPKRNPRRALP